MDENPNDTNPDNTEYFYVWVTGHQRVMPNGDIVVVAPHWRKEYFPNDNGQNEVFPGQPEDENDDG